MRVTMRILVGILAMALKRLLLTPVVLILWFMWLIVVVVEHLYSICHGLFFVLLAAFTILICAFQMWQNLVLIVLLGVGSYIVLSVLAGASVILETARISVIRLMES